MAPPKPIPQPVGTPRASHATGGYLIGSRAIGVPPRAINGIVRGKRAITPAMSIRSRGFLGRSDTFRPSIQVECDFRALARKRKQLVSGIQPAQSISSAT